jgi:phosphoribosyl 1,2-cyclic phosphate phosphodiesterase
MELLYMGTGAAEGIPGTFCNCTVCVEARKRGGREIRTRSQAIIDGKILLDFPPDGYTHYLNFKFDLPAISYLFVTHSHMDHFLPAEFELRSKGYVHTAPPVLHIYGNKNVGQGLIAALPNGNQEIHRLVFHLVEPFQKIEAGGYTVRSLRARHDPQETCLFYMVEQGGKTLLYAHDTGRFPDDTWDYLRSAAPRFDLVSLDCTAMMNPEGGYHMGIPDAAVTRTNLLDAVLATEKTIIVLNHFSHNGGLNHAELCAAAEKQNFLVSWDGMKVSV